MDFNGQKGAAVKTFDVTKYGAVGDGKTVDSAAIQKAIDEAAAYAGKAQVLIPGGRKYLVGTLELKGMAIDFHLADDAQLLVSTRREDYRGDGLTGSNSRRMQWGAAAGWRDYRQWRAGAEDYGHRIALQGRAKEFMTHYTTPRVSGGSRGHSARRCLC